jgi:arsenite-transporting ATPase
MPMMVLRQTASATQGTAESAGQSPARQEACLGEVPAFLRAPGAELLLFGGKGGVGKTTCAAAAALYLATHFPDGTFLVVSIDPAHSLQDCFARSPLPPNLKLLEIDSQECLRKFKEAHSRHLRQIALHGTLLDDDDVARLLDLSIPGLDEVMAFDEISLLLKARTYDCIVVDTAPTGHTLRFLELPEMLHEWFAAIDAMLAKHHYLAKLYRASDDKDEADLFLERLRQPLEHLASLLGDQTRCLFVPVMLAEPASLDETRRLVDRLERMRVPVRDILVNRLYPPVGDCPTCQDICCQQFSVLERLGPKFQKYALWEVPIQREEVRGAEHLLQLWTGVHRLAGRAQPAPTTSPAPRVDHPPRLPGPEVSLVLFSGKGGVGKTTLASATAFRLAEAYPDREVFLVSTDPAHSLSDCLAVPIGPEGTRVGDRLTALEIDAEAEFQELKGRYADEVAKFFDYLLSGHEMVDLEFEREAMEHFLDLSPPGLDELMAVARVVSLLGTANNRIVVLDTAPTGHLVRLLELPGLIQDWLKVMIGLLLKYKDLCWLPATSDYLTAMSRKVRFLRSLLEDPAKGRLYAVSALTQMTLEETRDLFQACRRLGIHVPVLFLNQVTSDNQCPLCQSRFRAESGVRREFKKIFKDVHQCVVYHCGELRGCDRLAELGRALYRT